MLNLRNINLFNDADTDSFVHEVTSLRTIETYMGNIGAELALDGDSVPRMRAVGFSPERVYHASGLIRPMDDAMYELRMLR